MNYTNFKEKLKAATLNTFRGCLERISKEEFCAFGLYTDESVMSISVSCNSMQNMKKLQNEEEGYDAYFKWTMGEWKYEMINHKDFADLNTELLKEFNKLEGLQAAFTAHRNKIVSICIEVLKELKDDNTFSALSNEFILMIGISDFDDKDFEKAIVKELNNEVLSLEFEKWIDTEED